MRVLKVILLALVLLALLVSNGIEIYQNNTNKSKIDKLQTSVLNVEKSVKRTDGDVANVCGALSECNY